MKKKFEYKMQQTKFNKKIVNKNCRIIFILECAMWKFLPFHGIDRFYEESKIFEIIYFMRIVMLQEKASLASFLLFDFGLKHSIPTYFHLVFSKNQNTKK